MKRWMITFAILMAVGYHAAQAQTGIRAGWNYTDIKGISTKGNAGFHAGLYHKVNFLGLLAIEPGVQYSQRNFEVSDQGQLTQDRLHYVDMPLVIRLGFIPLINLFGGPQASVLLARNYNGSTEASSLGTLSRFDLGGVVGLGINLPLGFNVQGSYDFGFKDLNYNEMETKSSVFKVSLGKNF
ncbi:hypothetical protein GCM10028791_30410 [Echinicola sediminis]